MLKDSVVQSDTVLGDGGRQQTGGYFDKFVRTGKRLVTGESFFTIASTYHGSFGKAHVGVEVAHPETTIALTLTNYGERTIRVPSIHGFANGSCFGGLEFPSLRCRCHFLDAHASNGKVGFGLYLDRERQRRKKPG